MILQEYLDKNYSKTEQHCFTHLYCSYNNLTSLKGIEKLTKLTYLDCSHNNLISLKGIENLTYLIDLHYGNNKLEYFNDKDTLTIEEIKNKVKKVNRIKYSKEILDSIN